MQTQFWQILSRSLQKCNGVKTCAAIVDNQIKGYYNISCNTSVSPAKRISSARRGLERHSESYTGHLTVWLTIVGQYSEHLTR